MDTRTPQGGTGEDGCSALREIPQSAILAGLTPAQAQAAVHDGAILVLAGAGTGKTRVLTRAVAWRIKKQGIAPNRILAVTFTNKAAGEMTGRIRAMLAGQPVPGWIGTFHGLAARQLRIEPEVAGLRGGFEILDADDSRRMIRRTAAAMHACGHEDAGDAGRDQQSLKTLCNRIGKFKDNLISPEEAPRGIEAMIAQANAAGTVVDAPGLRLAGQVYAEYQRRLRDANAADFGDLLLWPTLAMQHDEAYRVRWAGRWDCLLADEYQDVNRAQYRWLRLLGADHGRVFVVGDDDQAVFGWRGSDLAFIRSFSRDFPHAVQVRLEDNFRSTGHILAAANAVIAMDTKRLGKTLRATKVLGDRVEVVGFRDAEAEAHGVAVEIQRRSSEGLAWEDMAILYRSSALSHSFEEALMRARVPYVLVGDVGFWQRAEIKDALALLRLGISPDDRQSDEAFRRVCNTPARGLGPKAQEVIEAEASWRGVSLLRAVETAALTPKVRSGALAFADAIRAAGGGSLTLADQLSLLLDRSGYRAMLRESRAEDTEGRMENLQELLSLAGSFHGARDLLDHASLASAAPGEGGGGRVQLMTLHRSKGLEFVHAFLPAWDTGTFSSAYSGSDFAEERRLAYVALTRGMRRVTVTHCTFRRGFVQPSGFIADIPEEHRVTGWLREQRQASFVRQGPQRFLDDVDAMELLRRF